MRAKLALALVVLAGVLSFRMVSAQDLGPQIQKIKDGIYVYVGKNFNSNAGIVLTQDGVVLIDQSRCRGYRKCVEACPMTEPAGLTAAGRCSSSRFTVRTARWSTASVPCTSVTRAS